MNVVRDDSIYLKLCAEVPKHWSELQCIGTPGAAPQPAADVVEAIPAIPDDSSYGSAEPEDQFYGDRTYRARDCEGLMWTFAQHVRDVDPADFPRMD